MPPCSTPPILGRLWVCAGAGAGAAGVRPRWSGGVTATAAIGWALAVAAVAAGYVGYGWPGVLLAVTAIVFWLLLQFSRAVRVMRSAAGRPVGRIDSAPMLHVKLRRGMRLAEILPIAKSLGHKSEAVSPDADEAFVWEDGAGDLVRVQLRAGRVVAHALERAPRDEAPPAA
jgi:hypothetical protein